MSSNQVKECEVDSHKGHCVGIFDLDSSTNQTYFWVGGKEGCLRLLRKKKKKENKQNKNPIFLIF